MKTQKKVLLLEKTGCSVHYRLDNGAWSVLLEMKITRTRRAATAIHVKGQLEKLL